MLCAYLSLGRVRLSSNPPYSGPYKNNCTSISEPIALSLLPPVAVLILAIWLRRPIRALVLGAVSGLLLLGPHTALGSFAEISLEVMQDETIG